MAEAVNKKLIRTFSASNLGAARHIHEYIADQEKSLGDRPPALTREVTKSSMIIPSLQNMSPDLRRLTLNMVIDTPTLHDLEMEKSINWCSSARNLVPLKTDGDGNCLMHALSLYIWGVHDRNLTIRRFIHRKLVLENRFEGRLYKRWRHHQELQFAEIPDDVRFDSQEYRKDWDTVINTSSCAEFPNGSRGPRYGHLEDIHIFVSANILARPIIVLCENVYRGEYGVSLQHIKIGGIYLPLLRHPDECERSPIVLGFERGHFVPLVSCEDLNVDICGGMCHEYSQHCIPLVSHNLKQLSVHFLLPEEDNNVKIQTYLDCSHVPYDKFRSENLGATSPSVVVAMIKFKAPPAWSVELMWSLFRIAKQQLHGEPGSMSPVHTVPASGVPLASPPAVTAARGHLSVSPPVSRPSITRCSRYVLGCPNPAMSDSAEHKGMCEKCYSEYMISSQNIPKRRNVGSLKLVSEIQPVATCGASPIPSNPLQSQSPVHRVVTGKCIIPGCPAVGLSDLMNMCKDCYMKTIMKEPTNVPSHSAKVGNHGAGGRTEISGYQGPAYTTDGSQPINRIDRFQNLPSAVAERPSMQSGGKVKIFCDIPGCLEELEPGAQYCKEHVNGKDAPKPEPCVGEGCSNKAGKNDWNLCDDCLKKQMGAAGNLYQPPNDEIPPPPVSFPVTSDTFNAPTVYSGYPAANESFRATTQQIHQTDPQWHKQYVRPPSVAQPMECKSRLCKNKANAATGGYCTECYEYEQGLSMNLGRLSLASGKQSNQRCVNEDCGNPGRSDLNYLCQKCYDEQCRHIGNMAPSPKNVPLQVPRTETYPNNPTDMYPNPSPYGFQYLPGQSHNAPGFQNERKQEMCMMEGCRSAPQQGGNGMCSQCFRENLQREEQFRRQREREREEERQKGNKLPPDSPYLNPVPCKTVGCPRTGVRDKNEYCEICFNRMLQVKDGTPLYPNTSATELPRYSSSGLPPAAQPAATLSQPAVPNGGRHSSNNCLRPGCDFFGTPEYGGYCSKCFMNITKEDAGLGQRNMSVGSQQAPDVNQFNQGRGLPPCDDLTGSSIGDPIFIQGAVAPEKCLAPSCELYGRPEQRGYCSQHSRRFGHGEDVFRG